MDRKNTDGLRSELMDAPDLKAFLAANEAQFATESAVSLLNGMLYKRGMS